MDPRCFPSSVRLISKAPTHVHTKLSTVNAEILAGIKFGGFGYTSSHKNIGGF